jgi:hypothetical protein
VRVWVPGREGVRMRVGECSLAYPPLNAYAPYCDVIYGLCLRQVFRHYVINDTIFGKKLLNTKRVFCFSLQLLPRTFSKILS